jgi:hypothetical protein
MNDYLTFSRSSFDAFYDLMNYSFHVLCFIPGKIAMRTTKGRHLFSAKCHYLITEQILMRGMDQHKMRCYWCLRGSLHHYGCSFCLLIYLCLNYGQIKMSNETERRVENLLSRAQSNDNGSASTSTVLTRQSFPSTSSSVAGLTTESDKQKLSSQLRDLQHSKKVMPVIFRWF